MTAAVDRALLRFLRARVDTDAVLNDGPDLRAPTAELPLLLAARATEIRRAAASRDGRSVDYRRLRSLPAYRALQALTPALARFDPAALPDPPARLAFWLNLYNTLTIEAVVRFEPEGTIRQLPGFFRLAAYRVAGQRFSAEVIEHGILRGNRPSLARLPAPFAAGDPRLEQVLEPPDVRVHFALNCSTRSCPAWRVYDPASIAEDLDQAAGRFVAESVCFAAGGVLLAPLFGWYLADFGGPLGLAGFLARYSAPVWAARLRDCLAVGRFSFGEYDWSLNSVPLSPVT